MSKHCSNSENGIACDHLKYHLTFHGPSHPLQDLRWRAQDGLTRSHHQRAAHNLPIKTRWHEKVHFVMDNMEIWKTTCKPSILPRINLHIFTVALKKTWIVYSNKGELLMSTSDKRYSIKGAYARVGRDGLLPNIFEMACAGAIWRLKTSLELQWHITK